MTVSGGVIVKAERGDEVFRNCSWTVDEKGFLLIERQFKLTPMSGESTYHWTKEAQFAPGRWHSVQSMETDNG